MSPARSTQLTDLVLQVFKANGQMIAWGDEFTQSFDLTSARWQMLGAIALAPQPLTAPQLAQTMGVTRQGAQKQLNLLHEAQLIQKQANPNNQRSPFYQLTQQGELKYQAVDQAWQTHLQKLSDQFDSEAVQSALTVLKTLTQQHSHSA